MKSVALIVLVMSSLVETSFALRNYGTQKDSKLRKRKLGDDNSSSTCDKFSSRKFIEHAGSDQVVFNTEEGKLNPGDITIWNNDVYDSDDSEKVGSIQG